MGATAGRRGARARGVQESAGAAADRRVVWRERCGREGALTRLVHESGGGSGRRDREVDEAAAIDLSRGVRCCVPRHAGSAGFPEPVVRGVPRSGRDEREWLIRTLTLVAALGFSGCTAAAQPCSPDFNVFELLSPIGGQGFSVNGSDMDGDGDVDILIPRHEFAMRFLVSDGAADPMFEVRELSPCNTWGDFSAAVADLDGDGDLDVLAVAYFSDLIWYENLGGDPVEFCTHTVGPSDGLLGCAVADLDGDGDADLVAGRGSGENTIDWYENDGQRPPTFVRRTAAPWAGYPFYMHTGDLEADGDADIVSVTADNILSFILNDGGGRSGVCAGRFRRRGVRSGRAR